MKTKENLVQIDDYEKYVGPEIIDRIRKKAQNLQDMHIAHVNSTYYGGGVAVLLGSLTLLMNSLGIKTGWRVIQGSPDFFSVTKKMHNALQGGDINLSDPLWITPIYTFNIIRRRIRMCSLLFWNLDTLSSEL